MSEETATKWYCQTCRRSGSGTLTALPNKKAFWDHVKSLHPDIIKITEKLASFKCIECKFENDQKGNFSKHFKANEKLKNVECCPNFIITSKCAWRIHIDSVHDGIWNCSSCKSKPFEGHKGLNQHFQKFHKPHTKTKPEADTISETDDEASMVVLPGHPTAGAVGAATTSDEVPQLFPSNLTLNREQEILRHFQSFQGQNAQAEINREARTTSIMSIMQYCNYVQKLKRMQTSNQNGNASGQTGNTSGRTGNALNVPVNPLEADQSSLVPPQSPTHSLPE